MVIRATGICIKDDAVLLVDQSFKDMPRFWSLPGGKVEEGEELHEAIIREIKEETGIDVVVERLLYVTQRFIEQKHIVQVIFEVKYLKGVPGKNLKLTNSEQVHKVEFIKYKVLESYGISKKFADKIRSGFTDAGKYYDRISDLGL